MTRIIPKTVLVVDDIDVDRMLICDTIKKNIGLASAEAESGEAALEYLRTEEGVHVELILLDLFMPGIDGMETLRAIRAEKPWMPIVILTGSQNVDHAIRAIQSGAVNYLVKPIQEDRLILCVQTSIDMGKMRKEINQLRGQLDLDDGFSSDGDGMNTRCVVSLFTNEGKIKSMDDLEVEIADKILAHCNGNVSKASKSLGLARSTFYRKLSS